MQDKSVVGDSKPPESPSFRAQHSSEIENLSFFCTCVQWSNVADFG